MQTTSTVNIINIEADKLDRFITLDILNPELSKTIAETVKSRYGIKKGDFPLKGNAKTKAIVKVVNEEYEALFKYAALIKHQNDILERFKGGNLEFLGFNNGSPVFADVTLK